MTSFAPGDEVFGGRDGAFAEYVCVREERAITQKPANVTFEQAAATPVAGLTALQGLRDRGGVEPGQSVLVNGASGGVGSFAVQVAKALGGDVTGVCSTGNVELAARSAPTRRRLYGGGLHPERPALRRDLRRRGQHGRGRS